MAVKMMMIYRKVLGGMSLVLCPLLIGCGFGSGKPAPKAAAPQVRPSVQTRNDLISIAKRIEDAAAVAAIEDYLKNFEDESKGWTWSDLDELILQGGYSIQTKDAYVAYREANRRAKIAEAKK